MLVVLLVSRVWVLKVSLHCCSHLSVFTSNC
jgi:hypothetical protein